MRVSVSCLLWLGMVASPLAVSQEIQVNSRVEGSGELLPARATLVSGEVLHVAIKAAPGYRLKQIHGCDGQYRDSIFITGAVRYSCVIQATFVPDADRLPSATNPATEVQTSRPLSSDAQTMAASSTRKSNIIKFILVAHQVSKMVTVTAGISAGLGSITPVQQTLLKGQSASLLVTPAAGQRVLSVTGCGLNTSNSGVLQTPALSVNCHISVSFAALVQGLWDQFNWDQGAWQ